MSRTEEICKGQKILDFPAKGSIHCEQEVRMNENLEKNIKRLEKLNLGQLRSEWTQVLSKSRPKISSAQFLRYLIAWNLQEKAYGGLSDRARRQLKDLAVKYRENPDYCPSLSLRFKPGTVLTRHWNGKRHDAMVLEDSYQYEGRIFGSLSEIATHITGSRWSGPVFFGLKENAGKRNAKRKT